jgi:glutamate N-acetyltransferase/amino-acid N-acetyltransferase
MEREFPVVEGIRWGAAEAGIRKRGGLDLGLVLCAAPAAAAAVFTRSVTAAAPVEVSRERIRRGRAAAILVNAGCANAATADGREAAEATTAAVARATAAPERLVLCASTGVIGTPLPVDRVIAAVPDLVADAAPEGLPRFAEAIRTTDTFAKLSFRPAGRAMVIGCAKGAGMIQPNLATMLGFLATDAQVAPPLLRRLLREVVDDTFNAVTVDGDTSTNDSVFLLASGAVGRPVEEGSTAYRSLRKALLEVATELARAVARDGEGATKRIAVRVEGARTPADADRIARRIANSPLVKTAIHAADANWGRIVAAAGSAGVAFDPAGLEVALGPAVVVRGGVGVGPEAERRAAEHLAGDDVEVRVKVGRGRVARTVWTCDLSAEYVRINAAYRT